MTMYLPNRDVIATGFEAAEFLEVPRMADMPRGDGARPGPQQPTTAATAEDGRASAVTAWDGTTPTSARPASC